MRVPLHKRNPGWLPAAIVLGVVVLAGSRLIVLSVQQHAAQAHEAAQVAVARLGRAVESQLQSLVDLAQRQTPGRYTFRIAADGRVLPARDSDQATVQGIASEWAAVDAQQSAAAAGLLGPVRQGSQWIVAARAPIVQRTADGAARRVGWAIAYRELDQLLARAQLDPLVKAGYDFELSRLDPTSRGSRVFISSRTVPLNEPATSAILPSGGIQQSPPGSALTIAIRPRAGWYSASEIAADVGLLAVLAWLLTFGAYDLASSSSRLRAALATSTRQLQAVNGRLMKEIEERQSLQRSFDHARYHDAFTGLPNRRYFMDQLDRALRMVRTRRGQRIAIVLIDIDRFRVINDTLGHTAGDELMVQAARRFEKATDALECVLARWGGDQFALLLFDVHSSVTAMAIASLLQDALAPAFELRRHRLSVAARMGVTCADSALQRAEEVLRQADVALSAAKTSESTSVVAYDASMSGDVVSLVSLEADLQIALERDELRLLFQPVVDLRSQRIVGAEALLRWRHPVEGLLTPDKFLAIAEESGLVVPITRWIILRVCRLAGEWQRRLPQGMDFYISVNLSAGALRDPGLTEYVADVLQETRTAAQLLKFELTERGLISNVGVAREILDRLRGMGIQLMLDDFGTGYSSLSYLQLFPFDYVKIDRPLVNRAGLEPADSGIMVAMVQMASSLGLKAIAEIVETPRAVRALQQMGCDFGQGYFFGEPVEAEEMLQLLRSGVWQMPLEPAAPAVAGVPNGDSPAVLEAAEAAVARAPSDASSTEGVPIDDSPTLVEAAEPTAEKCVLSDNSPTLAETAQFATASVPDDNSPTLAETAQFVTASVPDDNSPTLVETAKFSVVSGVSDDSPTAVETAEFAAASGPNDASPTVVIPQRRPRQAGRSNQRRGR